MFVGEIIYLLLLPCGRMSVERQSKDSVTLSWSSGRHQVRVWHFPFRLEILCEDEVMVTFNSKGKLWFETLQEPPRWGCQVTDAQWIRNNTWRLELNDMFLFFSPLLFVLRATSESSEVRECDITRTLRIIWSVNTFLLLLVLLAAWRRTHKFIMERDVQRVRGYQS